MGGPVWYSASSGGSGSVQAGSRILADSVYKNELYVPALCILSPFLSHTYLKVNDRQWIY
jgi:hypothetical protein